MRSLRNYIKEHGLFLVVAVTTFGVLAIKAFDHTDIGLLQIHAIDEYAFHGSLRYMFDSALAYKWSGIFGFGFYQYGFVYFFINLIAAAPFLWLNETWLAIAAPRLVTALFAVGSLLFVYHFATRWLRALPAVLFTLFFIALPAFWENATWFHPDWPMTFWLIAAVFFLAKDNFTYRHNFWIAVVLYAIAVGFKYQAITFLPLIGMYICYHQLRLERLSESLLAIQRVVYALLIVGSVFLVTNPYIVHPMGWNAFSSSFVSALESNATNHGNVEDVTLKEKITFAVTDYYVNILFFFLLNVGAMWLVYRYLRKQPPNIFHVLAVNYLIGLIYLLYSVNKAWQVYYLPVITIGLFLAIYFISSFSRTTQVWALGAALVIQIVIATHTDAHRLTAPDYITYSPMVQQTMNEFIIRNLRPVVTATSTVLITPYTPFSYDTIGLSFKNIITSYGSLAKSSLERDAYIAGQRAYWKELKTDEELAVYYVPIDFIILRKDVPYIATDRITLARDPSVYDESIAIVAALYEGGYSFTLLAENNEVVIFKRHMP